MIDRTNRIITAHGEIAQCYQRLITTLQGIYTPESKKELFKALKNYEKAHKILLDHVIDIHEHNLELKVIIARREYEDSLKPTFKLWLAKLLQKVYS